MYAHILLSRAGHAARSTTTLGFRRTIHIGILYIRTHYTHTTYILLYSCSSCLRSRHVIQFYPSNFILTLPPLCVQLYTTLDGPHSLPTAYIYNILHEVDKCRLPENHPFPREFTSCSPNNNDNNGTMTIFGLFCRWLWVTDLRPRGRAKNRTQSSTGGRPTWTWPYLEQNLEEIYSQVRQ